MLSGVVGCFLCGWCVYFVSGGVISWVMCFKKVCCEWKGLVMVVGIFDLGFGGLIVLDVVVVCYFELLLVYLGDNKYMFYGVCDVEDIFNLICVGVLWLWDEGCDLVILVCNIVLVVVLKWMQEIWLFVDKCVLGVFVLMIEVLIEWCWGDNFFLCEVVVKYVVLFVMFVIVVSCVFQCELVFCVIGVDVEVQFCGGVVDVIEQGDEILVEVLVISYVEVLLCWMFYFEVVIFGCMYYFLVQVVFQKVLGLDVKVYFQL